MTTTQTSAAQPNTETLLGTGTASADTKSATTTDKASTTGADKTATEGDDKDKAGATTGDADKTKTATDETVAAEGAETDKDKDAGAQSDADGAPETYQFEAPEGVELDEAGSTAFQALLREDNMSQAKAQRYFDLFTKSITDLATQQQAAWDAEVQGWVDTAVKDQEIGGTEPVMKEKLGVAKLALDKFFGPDFGEVISKFKLGNHPGLIRGLYRMGLTLQEDKSVHRGEQTQTKLSDAEVFYGAKGA